MELLLKICDIAMTVLGALYAYQVIYIILGLLFTKKFWISLKSRISAFAMRLLTRITLLPQSSMKNSVLKPSDSAKTADINTENGTALFLWKNSLTNFPFRRRRSFPQANLNMNFKENGGRNSAVFLNLNKILIITPL